MTETVKAPDLVSAAYESLAVRAGGIVFTGGLSAANHGAGEHRAKDGLVEQFGATVAVVEALLEASGSKLSHVAKSKLTLADMRDGAGSRDMLATWLGAVPVSTVVGGQPMQRDDRFVWELVAGSGRQPQAIDSSLGSATRLGPLLFAAGTPVAADGMLCGRGDLSRQADAALAWLVAGLDVAGATVDDIVKVNNTTACWHDYRHYNQVYDLRFRSSQAARCSVSGMLEDPCALIEVEAVAALSGERRFVDSSLSGVGRSSFLPDPRTTYLPDLGPCKGPHTHGARAGEFVFIAGECPYDADDRLVGPGDIAAQTRRTMQNVGISLETLGASWADVVRTNVTLSDPRLLPGFQAAYASFFDGIYPARSVVATPLGQYGILVEIEAIAVVGATDRLAVIGARHG